jgi:hypothetical protein
LATRFLGALLMAVLLAFPVASALACLEMISSGDDCPMEPEGSQPTPQPAKMSCCYLSAAEPATAMAPFRLHEGTAVVVAPLIAAPTPVVPRQAAVAPHGLSPGQSSSLQQLYCVFLI